MNKDMRKFVREEGRVGGWGIDGFWSFGEEGGGREGG